jgi:hypothetical protein
VDSAAEARKATMMLNRRHAALTGGFAALALALSLGSSFARADEGCKRALQRCGAGFRSCQTPCQGELSCNQKCVLESKRCTLKVDGCGDADMDPVLSVLDCVLKAKSNAEEVAKCGKIPWP